jgi:ribose transport system substrate-binding protein
MPEKLPGLRFSFNRLHEKILEGTVMKKFTVTLLITMLVLCVFLTACAPEAPAAEPAAAEPAAAEPAAAEPAAPAPATEAPAVAEANAEPAGELAESDGDGPLYGILCPAATHGFVAAAAYYGDLAAEELGLNYRLLISANPNEQAGQLQELVTMGAECIVLHPHNDELSVAAQEVIDAGVPIINFDRSVQADVITYISGDNPGVGQNGARYIGEKLGGEGQIIMITSPNWGTINTLRVDNFRATLEEEFPNIEILNEYAAESPALEFGLEVMADALTANPHIDGVFTVQDELAMGSYQAMQEAGRTDIKVITGSAGMQSYFNFMLEHDEIWLASNFYHPSVMMDAVQLAVDYMDGKTVEERIVVPAAAIDRTNVDEYLDPDSPF